MVKTYRAIAACVMMSLAPSAEGQFVSVPIGPLGYWGSVEAVNESGQVAGYSFSSDSGFYHAFLWTQRGGMIDLGALGVPPDAGYEYPISSASAVNDRGQVVGFSTLPDHSRHAFSWTQAGGMIDLGTLGGAQSGAVAVNNSGQVVGHSEMADGSYHAFSWTHEGGMIDLGTLGGASSWAAAVNEAGQVVGKSALADGSSHAFSWTSENGMLDLGTIGEASSEAAAVNASGQVVGSLRLPGDFRAFSWTEAGGMIDLGTLGGSYAQAVAVNDSGQIVGTSSLADGGRRAFFWTQEDGMIDLGTLDQDCWASALNNNGQVVGGCHGYMVPTHYSFSWTKEGGLIDLANGGHFGDRGGAHAINDGGQIAGVVGYSGVFWKTDPLAEISLLDSMIQDMDLPFGTGKSLQSTLAAVSAALAAGDTATACDALVSFISKVNAQDGKKKITYAQDLIVSAGDVRTMLQCSY